MSVDIEPSGRTLLVAIALFLVLAIWLFSSGSLLTLLFLAVVIGVAALLLWAGGVRVARWLTGAGG